MKTRIGVRSVLAVLLWLSLLGSKAWAAETAENLTKRARAVLAQLEGRIEVAGLDGPVEVLRDRWGVPHIYATNQNDLFFAQGFVAAQDRLYQIDMWRRVAVGQTAEVLGPSAVVRDRFARLTKFRGDMHEEWSSYGADTRQIVASFTEGINAYIDHIGNRLPIEFQLLGYRPKKWRPEDCLGRMSVLAVAFNLRREVDRAELFIEETNPADPDQYKVGDRWRRMEILRETIPVRGTDPVSVELRYTRNGPVIHTDAQRNRVYALRWMGSEPGTAAYLSSLAIDRAGNWKQFLRATEGWKAPSENLVYADLLPLWEKGEYFPLAFSRKKVEEVTRHRLILEPTD